jgi:hypothetical protein
VEYTLPKTKGLLEISTAGISFNSLTLIIDSLRSPAGQTAFAFHCDAAILSKNHPSAFPQKRPSCRSAPLSAPSTLFFNKNPFNAILKAFFSAKNPKNDPAPHSSVPRGTIPANS